MVGIKGLGKGYPDLMLGATLDFCIGGVITAGDIRALWSEHCCTDLQFFKIPWPFDDILAVAEPQRSFAMLLEDMKEEDSSWH